MNDVELNNHLYLVGVCDTDKKNDIFVFGGFYLWILFLIMIIKQNLSECVFVDDTLTDLDPSWINK